MDWECPSCGHTHPTLPEACEKCGNTPEVVLNVWRCGSCAHEGIAGTATHCPNCKAEKGLGVETKVDASQRLEGAQALDLARGQWRYCAYCDTQVPPVDPETGTPNEKCPTCSGALTEAAQEAATEFVDEAHASQYAKEKAKAQGAADPEPKIGAAPSTASPQAQQKKGGGAKFGIIGLLVLIAIGIGLYFIFRSKTEAFNVEDRLWTRIVDVEKFGKVVQNKWRVEVPTKAYDLSCSKKIKEHKKVPNGTESYQEKVSNGRRCAKHGFKKKGGVSVKQCVKWETKYKTVTKTRTKYRNVPIYRNWCRYSVDKWHKSRELKAGGAAKDPPKWPSTADLVAGKERAGKQHATYQLKVKNQKGEADSVKAKDQQEWDKYPVGSEVLLEGGSGKRKIVPPKAK
jgi:hypothetical protein